MYSFTSIRQAIGLLRERQRIVLKVSTIWLCFLLAIPGIAQGLYPPLPVPSPLAGPSGEPGQIMLEGFFQKLTLFHGSSDDEADWSVHIRLDQDVRSRLRNHLLNKGYEFIGNSECLNEWNCNLVDIYSEVMVCDRHEFPEQFFFERFYSADFTLPFLLNQPPKAPLTLQRSANAPWITAPDPNWTGRLPAWDIGLIAMSDIGKEKDISEFSRLIGGRVYLQGAFVEDTEHRSCLGIPPPHCASAPFGAVKKTYIEIHPLDSIAFAMDKADSILMSSASNTFSRFAPPQVIWPTNYVKWRVAVFGNSKFHRINREKYMEKPRTTTWYLDLPSDAYLGNANLQVNVRELPGELRSGPPRAGIGSNERYVERGVESYEWTIDEGSKDRRRKLKITVTMKVPDRMGGIVVRDYVVSVTPIPDENYLIGDWDGDGKDNVAVRRNNEIFMDTNFDGGHDIVQAYGNGNSEDQYLVGDWDGDGKDNVAVRRGNKILMDFNFDGQADITQAYGNGNSEDQYLVGDWDGDGKDNVAVRRNNEIFMDTNFDGGHDIVQAYGNGNSEDQYLVGDWNGDGKDNIAVRRDHRIFMDFNFDGQADKEQAFGNGKAESQYLVGDWDGDGKSNVAVRRKNKILMDFNFDGTEEKTQAYGNFTSP